MPPKRDITKYSSYFEMKIPGSVSSALIIAAIGIFSGIVSDIIVHFNSSVTMNELTVGAVSGLMIVSLPALIMVMIIRILRRDMKTKHAMFAVLAVAAAYSIFVMVDSAVYLLSKSDAIAVAILILANASIYGYWFIINKIAVGQRKSAMFTAEIQPILNVIMYVLFGGYLFRIDVPIGIALAKLMLGMLVFLAMGYVILYLLDRPAKKKLSVSSVNLFSAMIGHWLYNLNSDTTIFGKGGTSRDVNVDIAVLYGNSAIKSVFVKPDIHYGPFGNVGGSMFTEQMGNAIFSRYGASPFIMHGAVNIDDNPMNSRQVHEMIEMVCSKIEELKHEDHKSAFGYIGLGSSAPCRAVDIRINEMNLLALSKAPYVTEDIERSVGERLEQAATNKGIRTMLVDMHNSRFETASPDELKGIYNGSAYVVKYENAIKNATSERKKRRLEFGSANAKFLPILHKPDLGSGYSSIGIFKFGSRKFGILCIDANNMLPGFRTAIIKHVREKHRIEIELCTTDTHSVNSIAMSARNALGRHTKHTEIIPVIDRLIGRAIADIEPVQFCMSSFKFRNFKVWGTGSEEILNKVSKDIIRVGKRVVPFVIAAAYILAGFIIYLI